MRYDYFANTTLRVEHTLYNFEMQLIIFSELFENADESDIWANDSELQMRYLELLKANNLLKSNTKNSKGTKDARLKSAPLEDFNLIKRREKCLTAQGYELLELIKSQSYKINNDFLQIDLISLFFLKAELNLLKPQNLLQIYLQVFKKCGGEISNDMFYFLPLINNFSVDEFVNLVKQDKIIDSVLDLSKQNEFLQDLSQNTIKTDYFKTSKGDKTAKIIVEVLESFILPLRNGENIDLNDLFIDNKYKIFRNNYLKYIFTKNKKDRKIKIQEFYDYFVRNENLQEFGKRFFYFIKECKLKNNLKDYDDLNRRYMNLSGIFEFYDDKVSVNLVFKMILAHSKSDEILQNIAQSKVSKDSLNDYFKDIEFINAFKKYDIKNPQDLVNFKQNKDKKTLQTLINTHFSKDKIAKILGLFEDRKNDKKIFEIFDKFGKSEATIPTIFEYIIAIAWHYIDEGNLDRILQAGLSLDSKLLPKSHAVGGEADFSFTYSDHALMIEVTLTEKTNQRRAEMESVSRHLGNLLLNLDEKIQQNSFGIFIAPYLDKNVLNDFRSRIYCYFEKDENFIKGMKILPLNTSDIIKILRSRKSYKNLKTHFQKLFESKNDWGSKWYEKEVKPFINSLGNSDV